MRRALASALLLFALPVLAMTLLGAPSALAAEIEMPDTIPGLEDPKEARRAIVAGMGRRNWQVERETPGRILAILKARRHVAKTWIDYSTDQITFSYGGSVNMKCKLPWPVEETSSFVSIHRRYNRWLRNLRSDIEKEVARRRARGGSASREP